MNRLEIILQVNKDIFFNVFLFRLIQGCHSFLRISSVPIVSIHRYIKNTITYVIFDQKNIYINRDTQIAMHP